MTAQRWWVKAFARWQARIDSVKGQVQALSLAVTAFSTFSLLLQNSGHGEFITPLGVVLAIGGPAYAYLFMEAGVWNQVNRDRVDKSANYAGPGVRIDDELTARGILAGMNGEQLTDQEREAISQELDAAWTEYRDGLPEDYFQ